MDAIRRTLRRLLADQGGATAIEYGLIAALIVVAMMAGLSRTWRRCRGMWTDIKSQVESSLTATRAVDDQLDLLTARQRRVGS